METDTSHQSASLKDESQLVTFLLKDEEFGFDIMSVQEIIRLPKMAKVPRTPAYVDGIANLRGVILPVIDMRTRFGMERAAETDRRLALELLAVARAILVPGSGETADKIADFLKERGL